MTKMATTHADAVLKAKGRSFYWARHLLGEPHARRATRLYGFCRYLDDIADATPSELTAKARLKSIALAISSGEADDAAVIDMIDLMRECRIEPAVVLELVGGVSSDLSDVRVNDEPELLRYCYRVAGTVGLMMCKALDVVDPAALPRAIDLGIGMQITNICRDVVEDAVGGRRYLPVSLLGNIPPADLIAPSAAVRIRVRACIATMLDRADEYYRSGEMGICCLPFGARAGILSAARLYRAIGDEIRARDYAVWDSRAFVGAPRKLVLTASAIASVLANRSMRRVAPPHDPALHDELLGFPVARTMRHGF